MKRALLLSLVVGLFTLFFVTSVYAINGPHMGPGFPATTDACAGCHRAHTGSALKLLKTGTSKYTFCTLCHNGNGANTDVVNGVFTGLLPVVFDNHDSKLDGEAAKGLNGGGFVQAVAYTDRVSRPGPPLPLGIDDAARDLKRHNVTGADTNTGLIAFGGGNGTSLTGGQEIVDFTCTSCHDPHGTKNGDGTERYRILKGGDANSPVNGLVTAAITSNEGAQFPDPTPADPTDDYKRKDYTKDMYKAGMADFCVACHTQYKTPQGTVVDPVGGLYNANVGDGPKIRFRHTVDVKLAAKGANVGIRGNGTSVWANMLRIPDGVKLPVEQPDAPGYSYPGYNADSATPTVGDEITCLTCHQSHGTSASVSTASSVAPANSATLLRLNNRGVCQDCHYK